MCQRRVLFTFIYHETYDFYIWRMIDIWHMFLGNMLYVCFLYIKFSTYEFMGQNNFLTVLCAKVGLWHMTYDLTYDIWFWEICLMVDLFSFYFVIWLNYMLKKLQHVSLNKLDFLFWLACSYLTRPLLGLGSFEF